MGNSESSTVEVVNLKAPPIYKIFIIQLIASAIVALCIYPLLGFVAAYSTLLGGLICTIPNGYFARKAFRYRGARNTPLIVKSFYQGQTGKLIMTTVMFALVFAGIKPIVELAVIIGFIVNIIVGLVASAYCISTK